MAGLNILTYLTAYLDASGRNGGKPPAGPELERFFPWNLTPADQDARSQPPRPGCTPSPARHHDIAAPDDDHAANPHARNPTRLPSTYRSAQCAPGFMRVASGCVRRDGTIGRTACRCRLMHSCACM